MAPNKRQRQVAATCQSIKALRATKSWIWMAQFFRWCTVTHESWSSNAKGVDIIAATGNYFHRWPNNTRQWSLSFSARMRYLTIKSSPNWLCLLAVYMVMQGQNELGLYIEMFPILSPYHLMWDRCQNQLDVGAGSITWIISLQYRYIIELMWYLWPFN